MKKLLVILVVVAFVAPLMVAQAMAAENLSIKGQYYVSGWSDQNFSDLNSDNNGDEHSYWTQRMRIQPQIKVADGVTANLRFDYAEYSWGDTNDGTYRPAPGTNEQLQVDRAYVDIDKGIVDIRAGLQFFGVGQNQVFRDNNSGFLFTIKTPVTIRLGYIKVAENGLTDNSTDDVTGTDTRDTDRYLASVGYKSDIFSVEGFYAAQVAGREATLTTPKVQPSVFGVYGKSKIGPVDVKGELAIFGGDTDNGTTKVDFVGTQFNAEGIMKISDMLSVGAEVIYSSGTKETNEQKIAYIGDPFARKSISTGGALFGDYYDGNWKPSSGTPLGTYDVFDPAGTGAGAIGGGIGAQVMPIEGLSFTGYFHYLTHAEDIDGGAFDNGYIAQVLATYMLAPKTMIQAAYMIVDVSLTDNADGTSNDTDSASVAWLNLTVNF